MNKIYILLFISILTLGCAPVAEVAKTTWGSSTRALEKAREDGARQTFQCSLEECFDFVEGMTVKFGQEKTDDQFVLFAKDKRLRYMVVMGVKDAVNTTEVGLFFDQKSDGRVQVEISSLSSRAKDQTARIVFNALAARFGAES